MDISSVEEPDKCPCIYVYAPEHGYVMKYLERELDMRVTEDAGQADVPVAFAIVDIFRDTKSVLENFRRCCAERGLTGVVLRVPYVVGTGMGGELMRMARGVSRGTLLCIVGNEARMAVVHATDVAVVARAVAEQHPDKAVDINLGGVAVEVNELTRALGVRIKDKRVGDIKPRWARILYGRWYDELTRDRVPDVADGDGPEKYIDGFRYVNAAEYLRTHVYDNESL